jgi:uncharacterized protein
LPSLRELVAALAAREGVEAVVMLGRDGLVIDAGGAPGADVEGMAAMVPSVLAAAEEFGAHGQSGPLRTAILEYGDRVAAISSLTGDTALLVLARPGASLGTLLFELRRHREQIAALV